MLTLDQGLQQHSVGPKVDGSHDLEHGHIEAEEDVAAGHSYRDNWSIELGVLDHGKSLVFSDFLSLLVIVDLIKLLDS